MIKVLVIADVLMAGAFAWAFRSLPEQIPLFYSKPWGEAQIADVWYLFLLPVLMHIVYFTNDFFVKKYFPEDEKIRKIMWYTNIFFIASFTAVFIKILFLVS
ncbi:hypothetical protein KBD81_01635 [Candidatus Woesebacteria bacterium]|nr:hypothetical protein [Candidatus Woesebacteria bacterium]